MDFMSVPWPEPEENNDKSACGRTTSDPAGEFEQIDEAREQQMLAALNDPYARIHEALDRSAEADEVGQGWHITDFVVVAAAESSRHNQREQTLMLYIGPKNEMPPHRTMGLLDYARQRYNHNITCCRCGGPEEVIDEYESYDPGDDEDPPW